MQDLLARLRDVQFVRYILASVGALAVDMACFLLLLATGTSAVVASAAGYSAGIAAHWLMSTPSGMARDPEQPTTAWQVGGVLHDCSTGCVIFEHLLRQRK